MSTYERIKRLMNEKNVSAYQAAKSTNINQSSFSDWKRGKSKPSATNLETLANYFGVSIGYLLNGETKESENSNNLIPLIGTVPCGTPLEAIEDVIEWIEVVPSQKDCFALIAKGLMMNLKKRRLIRLTDLFFSQLFPNFFAFSQLFPNFFPNYF